MNRKLCLYICMVTCLLVSCSNPKLQKVSDDNHINSIEKGEPEKWEVIDISGNKQLLDIGNIPIMNQNVEMGYIYYPAEYVQAYDGHYYYMTYLDKVYTLYRDHGNKVGSFQCQDGYELEGCVKYKDRFYVAYCKKDANFNMEFGQIDFDKQKINYLFTQSFEIASHFFVTIYDNQVCFLDLNNQYVCIRDFKGNYKKNFNRPDQKEGWWKYSFRGIDKKNLYYQSTEQNAKRGRIICVNQDTGKQSIVFDYVIDKNIMEEVHGISNIEKLDDMIYITEVAGEDYHHRLYIIDERNKKMQLIFSNIESWTVSDRYIFYTDKKHYIYRVNKGNGKKKVISKMKAGDIKCVGDELYVRKYDEYIDDKDDYSLDDRDMIQPCIYAMDFDGENVVKCVDAK